MSRSGYSDEYDESFPNAVELYRRAVDSAVNGKRGQVFLRDLLKALDAKPEKTLVSHALVTQDGNHCALGVIGALRGIDMPVEDPDGDDVVDDESTLWMASKLNIAPALAREIVYLNDDAGYYEDTDEKRFQRVRNWVAGAIHGGKS